MALHVVVFLMTVSMKLARTLCWHLRKFLVLRMRSRLGFCFLPIHLQKFMVGSQKSVMLLWIQRKTLNEQ